MPKIKSKPRKLSRHLFSCISRGAKTHGTYDPDEILYLFEEELTLDECTLVVHFLNWLHENQKGMGHGNRDAVYAEYIQDTGFTMEYPEPWVPPADYNYLDALVPRP
jgi:hypothetical protein